MRGDWLPGEDCKSCKEITELYVSHEQGIFNTLSSRGRESILMISGLSTPTFIHQTSTAHFQAAPPLPRLSLKAVLQSAALHLLYIDEKCKRCCIKFLDMQVRRCDVGTAGERCPGTGCPVMHSDLMVCIAQIRLPVPKKLPPPNPPKLVHFLSPRPPVSSSRWTSVAAVTTGAWKMNKPPTSHFKIMLLSLSYQPAVHRLSSPPCKRMRLPAPD